ncbi:MAG TPA: hypothetical protein VH165_11820 [Kofleriaceae bacterium]|jgi:hypothetical protein|nr:hypothetical protein [Kofleriaceae bacterium]
MHDSSWLISIGMVTMFAMFLSPTRAPAAAPRNAAPVLPPIAPLAAPPIAPPAGPPIAPPSTPPAGPPVAAPAPPVARSPAQLDALLARYDRGTPDERRTLGPEIDAAAAQRYAVFSRLYWYTDLDEAKQAARRLHRPILALRMLGDLRADLSCANSRLFRATLYANAEVSAFLRGKFVLYWSSEREVPKVTIDFGDGRKLVRTVTGNSAHYVLDAAGHVLDVLPGLYAPRVFQRELARSLALADRVRDLPDPERVNAVVAYHATAAADTDRAWQKAQGVPYAPGRQLLIGAGETESDLARAQRATMSKRVMEIPDLKKIGMVGPGELPEDDSAAWSAIGQQMWNIQRAPQRIPLPPQPGSPAIAPLVLDAASRTLVSWLHNAGPADQRATPAQLETMLGRLEQHIVADTAINQFRLRQAIHRQIVATRQLDFAALNAWIYGAVFATPSSDPWLGLRARTEFSGLPGDGVVVP